MSVSATTVDVSGPIRRVAFTCDFLRFAPVGDEYASFQPRNLAWLVEVLTGASAWKNRGAEVSVVMPPREKGAFEHTLGNPAALADYRESADHAWARRYDAVEPDAFLPVFDQLLESDLVVGFELAPTIKRWLHGRGRPYVNFYVHPLRFLRDLCLGATTNSTRIADLLRAHQIQQMEIDSQVRRFRALFARRQLPACAIPAGLPVLIGQTERDSVLIRSGKFVEWQDYRDQVAQRLQGFDTVAFLEHPSRPSSSSIVEHLRGAHGKTVVSTNANSYGVLFSNTDVPAVFTLASSLGVEARAMGFETHFLLDDPRDKFRVTEVDHETPGALAHDVLTGAFWDDVLGARTPPPNKLTGVRARDDFQLGENYLRNSIDAWSYRALQMGVETIASRKTLTPGDALDSGRRGLLLAGMVQAEPKEPLSPRQAMLAARSSGLTLVLMDSPIAVGEQRSVGLGSPAAAAYLANGFHAIESWGGWSSELQTQLAFPMSAKAVAEGACLGITLKVRIYEGLLPQAPALRISHDGKLLGYAFFRPSSPGTRTIHLDIPVTSALMLVDLELTDLESPAARGESGDSRWLGYTVVQLDVSCSERTLETNPEPVDALKLWGINAQTMLVPIRQASTGTSA
jgi:hypothetical protein